MILQVDKLHWLSHMNEQQDLCAHGAVEVQIGEDILDAGQEARWCVSAAALYLLRTLTADHTQDAPVGEHLIPCCGHTLYSQGREADVVITGCPNGLDWKIRHRDSTVLFRTPNGREEQITLIEWQQKVVTFADTVELFYKTSVPKQQPDDSYDAAGYVAFWTEWSRRYPKS